MSVKEEPSGRRSVSVEVEVPGTPEEVWQAIASAKGLSSWFVPAVFEEKDGKPVAVTLEFGPGMNSRSDVKLWEPPFRFFREGSGWVPGSPPLATEFTVEARAGGVCVVRVVQSLFASTDDWDGQLTGSEEGWPGIFRILKLYLAYFSGQPSAIAKVMAPVPGATPAEAWAKLIPAMGMSNVTVGEYRAAAPGAPTLGGVVEYYSDTPFGLMLRLDAPSPGIAAIGTIEFGEMVMVALTFFFYGEQAEASAASEEPQWEAWVQKLFAGAAS